MLAKFYYYLVTAVKALFSDGSAGFPAFGLTFMIGFPSDAIHSNQLCEETRLNVPDVPRVLCDGTVAGELTGPGHVQDRLA